MKNFFREIGNKIEIPDNTVFRVLGFVILLAIMFGGMSLIRLVVQNFAYKYIYTETGSIVDVESLPQPLYPSEQTIEVYESPDGKVIGTITRAVVYPLAEESDWVQAEIYGWVWNDDLTEGIGNAIVQSDTAEFRPQANFVPLASIYSQAKLTKLYVNKKNSWALCVIEVWIRKDDLGKEPRKLSGWEWVESEYPMVTWVSKEAGDVQGNGTVKTIYDSAPMILMIVAFAIWVPINLAIFTRRRRTPVNNNFITISGVTSSSINVQSPFASALTTLDAKGSTDSAIALLQLRDLVEQTKFNAKKKQQVVELLDTIADEAQKSEPRKVTIRTLVKETATMLSSIAVIADKVPPLIERISHLWK